MHRGYSLVLGLLALLATVAALSMQAVVASQTSGGSVTHIVSILSALLETVTFCLVGWLLFSTALPRASSARACPSISSGAAILVPLPGCALSAVSLVMVKGLDPADGGWATGLARESFIAGASACLAVSAVFQIAFLVLNFLSSRGDSPSSFSKKLGRSTKSNLRAIRYSQTLMPSALGPLPVDEEKSMEITMVGKASAETLSSPRSSISHVVKPVSSRTRLLSVKDKRRPPSLESCRHSVGGEDGFETWDTTTADSAYKPTFVDVSSSVQLAAPRHLETIPASPIVSHYSPSLESVSTLEPPCPAHLSRSSSPASSMLRASSALSMNGSASELHIHPLFRTDSPTPPPMATPGTSVVASPNAGQIITHKQSVRSIRSMKRMRSGSLATMATTGPSPLSRQGSFDDGASRWTFEEHGRPSGDHSSIDERRGGARRDLTPPIPEWVLNADGRVNGA
jgi:hypothetical protein